MQTEDQNNVGSPSSTTSTVTDEKIAQQLNEGPNVFEQLAKKSALAPKPKKSKKGLIIILIIVLLLIGSAAVYYFFFYNTTSKNTTKAATSSKTTSTQATATEASSKTYSAADYVTITNVKVNSTTAYTVKQATLKNLPEGTTFEFTDKQSDFVTPGVSAINENTYSNTIIYEVYKNILSIYVEEITTPKVYSPSNPPTQNNYSLNINLDTKKIMTNQELLDKFNVTAKSMYQKILTNIGNTVTTDEFLMSTTGNVDAATISKDEFSSKISTYAATLNNRYDVPVLYIKNGKLYSAYQQQNILNLLGMGTHMGIGLVSNYQTLALE